MKMLLLHCVGLFFVLSSVSCEVIPRVYLTNTAVYMTDLIQRTVTELETLQWSTLKVDDFTIHIDETVVGMPLVGTLNYTNGFLFTIQHVNILKSSLGQHWTHESDNTVRAQMKGQLRMVDAALGWDLYTDVNGNHFYSGVVEIPLLIFDFSVFKNMHTHEITVTATHVEDHNALPKTFKMNLMPADTLSDKLMSITCNTGLILESVNKWATEVMQPIAHDLVMNKLDFPGLCYHCTLLEAEEW